MTYVSQSVTRMAADIYLERLGPPSSAIPQEELYRLYHSTSMVAMASIVNRVTLNVRLPLSTLNVVPYREELVPSINFKVSSLTNQT